MADLTDNLGLEAAALGAAGAGGATALANPKAAGAPFSQAIERAAEAVTTPQQAASAAMQDFARGADGELHQTMLTMDRADISLKFFVSVRNRALEAYREIMRMGG